MLIHESILKCKQRAGRVLLDQRNFLDRVVMGNASSVGLSTLAGFLAAISFKLLE